MKRLPLIFILTLGLVVAGLVSCEKEVVKEAEPLIKVTEVVASADSVTQGETVTLTATVETDAEVDMSGLEYKWFASEGDFMNHVMVGEDSIRVNIADTVMWKAPGNDGVYTITVHVTDGENIATGVKNIGVNVYAPTASNYYVGDEDCSRCHSGTHEGWAETGHAEAWASLQNSGNPASYCEPCHSVQQDDTEGNSGYDEVPTEKFVDVQCESCHGPGSDHINGPSPDNIKSQTDVLAAETCGVCHEGAHNPYYDEWKTSGHGTLANTGYPQGREDCGPCHSGAGFVDEYDSEYGDLYATSDDPMTITCGVCHDSHSAENHGQLRTLQSVTFVQNGYDSDGNNPETVDFAGPGQLCLQCHRARRAPEGPNDTQISEGYAHFGPHPGGQGDVVYGESGYEAINQNMTFASSGHGLIEEACATCHVHPEPYGEFAPDSAYTGHTFLPTTQACANCHGDISEFNDITAKKDYDADGSIEGIQHEVEGLMDLLAETLVNYDTDNYSGKYLGGDATVDYHVVIDSLAATVEDSTEAGAVMLRKGGYNLALAAEDGSHGVHNPAYVIQLLQQSILFLDPDGLSDGVILRENRATTFVATNTGTK